jgi:hypothetical protein
LEGDLAALESAIQQVPECRLVVIDPITAYLGNIDSHNASEVRGLLRPLVDLAARNRVAVVGITHLTKSFGAALYRILGSIAFAAVARVCWYVRRDPRRQEYPLRRLMIPMKNNLAVDMTGMAYTLQTAINGSAAVVWEPAPLTEWPGEENSRGGA